MDVFGCTDRPGEAAYQYPYPSNPAVVDIERDYLLDVVTGETNPAEYHPLAVQAQVVAARTYLYNHVLYQDKPHGVENSTDFQMFIPYRFENRLGPDGQRFSTSADPCRATGQLTKAQRVLCAALAPKQYLTPPTSDLPINAEFFGDIPLRTLDGGELWRSPVDDPISIEPLAEHYGPGIGMSQRGASRWGFGNQGEHNGGDRWSVQWDRRDQILAHYYSGVALRDTATLASRMPAYRWNPLKIDWGGGAAQAPMLTHGGAYPIGVQVQNTSALDWTCATPSDRYELRYRWTRQSQGVGAVTRQEQQGAHYADLCGLARSASRDVRLTLDDLPGWGPGTYTLVFDISASGVSGSFRFADAGWPAFRKSVRVCPAGGCARAPQRRDIALVFDTTMSMGGNIAIVKAAAAQLIAVLAASGDDYRVSVIDYRDVPHAPYGTPIDYPARVALPFSSDPAAITRAINSLTIGDGGDWPETALAGLMAAIGQSWRADASRDIVLLGDAPPHDPEPDSGYTSASVSAAARSAGSAPAGADPALAAAAPGTSINIHPIIVSDNSLTHAPFQALADATGGTFAALDDPDLLTATLLATLDQIVDAPRADAGGPYEVAPNRPLTFNGLASVDPDGWVERYEWDVDGDGLFDLSSVEPTVAYTYTVAFSGTVTLRATDSDGHTSSDTAAVSPAYGLLHVGTYLVGLDPTSLATADLDRDGALDVVVANNNSRSIGICLGNGDGTLQPMREVALGATPVSVVIGDLNGDRTPDVVTGNSFDGSLSVLLGDGAGGFGPPSAPFQVGGVIRTVALARLNADSWLDLAFVQTGIYSQPTDSHRIGIMHGNGDGTFRLAVSYALANPEALAIGDVNRDGRNDIVAGTGSDVSVLINHSDGTLHTTSRSAVGGANQLALGDLNRDGTPDIVVATGSSAESIQVLFGRGDGTFQPPQRYAGPSAQSVALSNMDSDGALDVVAARSSAALLTMQRNNGTGMLLAARGYHLVDDWASDIDIADLNADDRPDVLVADRRTNTVQVFLNIFAGRTPSSTPTRTPTPVTLRTTTPTVKPPKWTPTPACPTQRDAAQGACAPIDQ